MQSLHNCLFVYIMLLIGLQSTCSGILVVEPQSSENWRDFLNALPLCLQGEIPCLLMLDFGLNNIHIINPLKPDIIVILNLKMTNVGKEAPISAKYTAVAIVAQGDVAVVGTSDGRLAAIDLWNSHVLWEISPTPTTKAILSISQLDDGNIITTMYKSNQISVYCVDWKLNHLRREPVVHMHMDVVLVQAIADSRYVYVATPNQITVYEYNGIKSEPCLRPLWTQHKLSNNIRAIVPVYDCSRFFYVVREDQINLLVQNTYFELFTKMNVRIIASGMQSLNCSKYVATLKRLHQPKKRSGRRLQANVIANERKINRITTIQSDCRDNWPYLTNTYDGLPRDSKPGANDYYSWFWRLPSTRRMSSAHRMPNPARRDWMRFRNAYNSSRAPAERKATADVRTERRYVRQTMISNSDKNIYPLLSLVKNDGTYPVNETGECFDSLDSSSVKFCIPKRKIMYITPILSPRRITQNLHKAYEL